jgi:uncharacterized pyridoxamine 5'-phosphate oxidase family protein
MKLMSKEEKNKILDICDEQSVAVLGTIGPKDPYSCLMSFDITRNLSSIYFCTKRARRKYRNILHNPRVSLVIDNRNSDQFDLMSTKVVTIIGSADDYDGPEKEKCINALKQKHPYLTEFYDEDDTALIVVEIEYLYLIDNFERVHSFES